MKFYWAQNTPDISSLQPIIMACQATTRLRRGYREPRNGQV